MWGDAEGASTLDSSHPLSTVLLQITGPAHVPLRDPRWQDLLHHYDTLVHLDHLHESESVVGTACASMAKHGPTSSNLAALSLRVSRMVRDLQRSVATATAAATVSAGGGGADGGGGGGGVSSVSDRIALVGKARATCGALNLLRILVHETIVTSCRQTPATATSDGDGSEQNGANGSLLPSSSTVTEPDATYLEDAFTYRSRDAYEEKGRGGGSSGGQAGGGDRDAAMELIASLLSFASFAADGGGVEGRNHHNIASQMQAVPELYDAAVQVMSLILVLLSTQLYQPFVSSAQKAEMTIGGQAEAAAAAAAISPAGVVGGNFFLDKVMDVSQRQRQHQRQKRQRHEMNHHGRGDGGADQDGMTGMEGYAAAAHEQRGRRDGGARRKEVGADSSLVSSDDYWAQSILMACLTWLVERPTPPPRSIASHYVDLAQSVVQHAKGEILSPDGMYENHSIVMARAPSGGAKGGPSMLEHTSVHADKGHDGGMLGGGSASSSLAATSTDTSSSSETASVTTSTSGMPRQSSSRVILNATRGVLVLSSSLLLLPFRLMNLAFSLFGDRHSHLIGYSPHGAGGDSEYDHARYLQLQATCGTGGARRTCDVLWLTDSPLADFGCALLLLLANNHRSTSVTGDGAESDSNPFRAELASLNDNRWEGRTVGHMSSPLSITNSSGDGGDFAGSDETPSNNTEFLRDPSTQPTPPRLLSVNFESLFESFGLILHTEVGELCLYTLLQSSPIFAASVAVRSDLDTLVVPLLRTLYFSSAIAYSQTSNSTDSGNSSSISQNQQPPLHRDSSSVSTQSTAAVIQNRPFRSQSQLYVILILLLLFSQDPSFGPDSFRRVQIAIVPWYKERHIKDISLGSLLVLILLRSITFNLNRLRDAFLLSNCCAVLLNLSPHIVNLHPYAAMRLASVTVSCMKRFTTLVSRHGGKIPEEGDLSSILGMYGEACRTLIQLLKHSIRGKFLQRNLHLVYSLVYQQTEFNDVFSSKASPFKPSDVGSIASVIEKADTAIREEGGARTAEHAMEILQKSVATLKGISSSSSSLSEKKGRSRSDSFDSIASDASDAGDFTFTYEEESDPEIFFVPYVWEVITCTVTAGTMEWNKNRIHVFPLLGGEDFFDGGTEHTSSIAASGGQYKTDIDDVV